MDRFVSVGDRKFKVIRECRQEMTSDQVRESIKNRNMLIDVVLSDGKGNLLFCHEARIVEPKQEGDDPAAQ